MIWIFGYLQLCVYGAWAAISGDFDLSFGLTKEYHEQEELELHNIMHHYFRPENFVESPAATRRSFKVASGVFAASRVVLLCQYLIVLYFARKQRRPCRPIYYNMLGCTLSGLCWFAAVGLSYYDAEAFAISRIVLWALGLVVELAGMIMAAVVQPSINLDLEYWAERFSALTLIVLGEGSKGRPSGSQRPKIARAHLFSPLSFHLVLLASSCGPIRKLSKGLAWDIPLCRPVYRRGHRRKHHNDHRILQAAVLSVF